MSGHNDRDAVLSSAIPDPGGDEFAERSDLVLTCARVLHANGQSTDEMMAAAERLGRGLDVRVRIIPRWGELQLQAEEKSARLVSVAPVDPTGVDMARVASAMRAIDEVGAGRLGLPAAEEAITAISHAPPAPTWLFTLAAAAGRPLRCRCSLESSI